MKNKETLRVSDGRLEELRQYHKKLMRLGVWVLEDSKSNVAEKLTVGDNVSVVEELQHLRQREDEDKHTLLDSELLQTIDGLRKQNKLLIEDSKDIFSLIDDEDSEIPIVIHIMKMHNRLMESIEAKV